MNSAVLTGAVDLREKGRTTPEGVITLDRRLFVQFLAFGNCREPERLARDLASSGLEGVLYEDINDPFGVGLVTYNEDAGHFVTEVRRFLAGSYFSGLSFKEEYSMFGRTYALGHEGNLEETLINRPTRNLRDPSLAWGIWYPLRRTGAFEELPAEDQRAILAEHGKVGHAFGRAGAGHDVRLASHGMNKDDNDFVIGILGPELHPLSLIVQAMRKTRQTSRYLGRLGPFFTGRVAWRSSQA